jgi:hypothetical protein
MRPITVTVGPLASASATNIRTASGVTGAGNLTLNGSLVTAGVAILDTPRRILFTTTADETTKTILMAGTNWAGDLISETVTLVNTSTVASVLDYKTVTSAYCSAALTGNLSIGTNGVAASPWVRLDDYGASYISVQARVSGTVNYTLQQTLDDPNAPTSPVAPADVLWRAINDPLAAGATASIETNYMFAPTWCRVLLNSQTNPGYVTATYLQSGTPI